MEGQRLGTAADDLPLIEVLGHRAAALALDAHLGADLEAMAFFEPPGVLLGQYSVGEENPAPESALVFEVGLGLFASLGIARQSRGFERIGFRLSEDSVGGFGSHQPLHLLPQRAFDCRSR